MKVPEGSGGGGRGGKQFVQNRQREVPVDRPRDRKRSRPGGDDRTGLLSDGLWEAKYQARSGEPAWATWRREVHAEERKAGMSSQSSGSSGWLADFAASKRVRRKRARGAKKTLPR